MTATSTTVCSSIKIVLRIFGVWPEDASCVALRRLFWFVMLIVTLIFQYGYFVLRFHTVHLTDLMDSLSCSLAYSLLLCKLIVFWTNQRKFRDILTMIATDWKECAGNSFSMHITVDMASLSHRISNAIIGLHALAVITYSFSIFLSNANDDSLNTTAVPVSMLIIKMELPFDHNSTPIYELVILVQFFQLLSNACAIDVLNALIMTLTFHIGGQIDILREWLINFFSEKDTHESSFRVAMGNLIGKHQRIIVFSKNIEDLYCYIALMQFVSNTLIICSIGFVIISSVGNFEMLLKTLLFYIVMNLEAFIFCFAGEYLSTKSQHIADAAYASLWYNARASESRMISILILRSQRQLSITVGKMMDLSLQRFTSIVKASASYVSMLLAMS